MLCYYYFMTIFFLCTQHNHHHKNSNKKNKIWYVRIIIFCTPFHSMTSMWDTKQLRIMQCIVCILLLFSDFRFLGNNTSNNETTNNLLEYNWEDVESLNISVGDTFVLSLLQLVCSMLQLPFFNPSFYFGLLQQPCVFVPIYNMTEGIEGRKLFEKDWRIEYD